MKIHKREQKVNEVTSALRKATLDVMGSEAAKDLTPGEYLRVVASAFGDELTSTAKFMIREERHGDPHHSGGLEGPIDLVALRRAMETLRTHAKLLESSIVDERGVHHAYASESLQRVLAGLRHIVEDEFRSNETRGGS